MKSGNRAKSLRMLRLGGRLALALVVIAVIGVVGMQFEGIIAKNVAIARELSASRSEVGALTARKERQLRTIRRLSDARGAVPEIHDKLRLVGPHEEIIYVRGDPQPTASPDSYGTER